jgi:hypothetical protein
MAGQWQPHPSRAPQQIAFVLGVEHMWDECRVPVNACVIRFFNEKKKIDYIVLTSTDLRLSAKWIVRHYEQRPEVEVTFKEMKTGLHLGQMQVTKEERRVQRSIALPVMAYLLLLRLYGSELEPGESASIFALKQRFSDEAYQEQFDRIEARYEEKLKQYKRAT